MLIRLGHDDERDAGFDCGDRDLNEFFFEDSRKACSELVAVTYALIEEKKTKAFFSVSNDAINREELPKSRLKKISHDKRYASLPAVKIGRLAIHQSLQGNGLGTELLNFIKSWFTDQNKTGCRFIVVDAYKNDRAVNFYKQNGFSLSLAEDDKNSNTQLMLFDLRTVRR